MGARSVSKIKSACVKRSKTGPMAVIKAGKHEWLFPVVAELKYLGTLIGYGQFEDSTVAMRVKQAQASFSRLRQTLHSNRRGM